jgi:hypothetical protein
MPEDLELLTGEAGNLLEAVLAETGGQLCTWVVAQVDHQPGSRTTVGYEAEVRWADGTVTDEWFGASSGDLPEGVVRLSDGDVEVGMWRYPFDPDLPGLPLAVDPVRARKLVESTGLNVGGDVSVSLRAYRPRRRAVVEVGLPGERRVFLKIVPKAKALHERHRLAASAAVPASLGWSEAGIVVLAGLPGRTLRDLLLVDGPVVVEPESVTAALDGLSEALADTPRRKTWGQKAFHYAEVIAATAPSLAERARGIASAVYHESAEGPGVAVHGDFYESQLLMHNGRVSGLLDIDTAGCGERLDDAGCLLAHLSVLAQIRPRRAAEITTIEKQMIEHFAAYLDWQALRRRAAAVVLSLATGPHRVQEPDWLRNTGHRLDLAERWLER